MLKTATCLPKNVAESGIRTGLLPEASTPEVLADILVSRAGLNDREIFSYVGFLKSILEASVAIAELFDLQSPAGSEGKKEHLRHTSPEDVMQIANYLYVLDSYGVQGCVLECGVSHGYSTCCLSHACAWLGRKLFSADSFEGLPSTPQSEPFFRQGDYASPAEEVKNRVRLLGRPDSVELVKGWYSESLRNWRCHTALLWVDVDLYESAKDVIVNVLPQLDCQGGIVMHEFTDFDNRLPPRDAPRPPNAVYDVFEERGIPWDALHLHRYLGVILFHGAVAPGAFRLLPALVERLQALDARSRQYRELRDSRTVRWAFSLKRLFTRKSAGDVRPLARPV